MHLEELNIDNLKRQAHSRRWGADLVSQIPESSVAGTRCLESGSGNGAARDLIESFGYRWTGIDIVNNNVSVQCDGHFLPFQDESFELVLTVAVFEHLYDPFKAAEELYRVLRPGGVVVGTTAFLEHFHANSYFHMTHRGVERVFSLAGFQIERVWPTWHFTEALASFWIPAQLSVPHKILATTMRFAAGNMMHVRSWGLRQYLRNKRLSPDEIEGRVQAERLSWTGAIGFRARKSDGFARAHSNDKG